jgi:hypothetical protein
MSSSRLQYVRSANGGLASLNVGFAKCLASLRRCSNSDLCACCLRIISVCWITLLI